MSEPILKVENLSASYGSIVALKSVSMEVYEGEIVTIIGANGAGKTTLLSCISGLMPYKGEITFHGEKLGGKVVKVLFVMELAGLEGRKDLEGYDVDSVIVYPGK